MSDMDEDKAIRPDAVIPDPAIDVDERPEIMVGAAFVGGVVMALLIKWAGR